MCRLRSAIAAFGTAVPCLLRHPDYLLHDAVIPIWGDGEHRSTTQRSQPDPDQFPRIAKCDSRTEEPCLMTKRIVMNSLGSVSLALITMPAGACPRQVAAPVSAPAPRVRVIATADGFAIAAKTETPAAAPQSAVPLGVQMQIDRDAFECSTRRFASARP